MYYATKLGDEENIEPLASRNNNTTSANNNNLLYQLQGAEIKREVVHMLEEDERPGDDVVLTTSSPYTGEILIENPETGRFVPLKLEDQLVYVTAATGAEGLPAYYRPEENPGAASPEFMDVVSWWEQEQGRLQMGQQQRLAHV